jgi:pentatricopeptide repeat protein
MPRKKGNIHYIYKTTCLITGKYYIGMHSTTNFEDGYMGSGKRLRYSIRKYGLENHHEKALEIFEKMKEADIRVEIDLSKDGFGKKVRAAKTEHVPYFIIIGDKDIEAGKVTLESRDAGQIGQLDADEVIAKIVKEIKEKK